MRRTLSTEPAATRTLPVRDVAATGVTEFEGEARRVNLNDAGEFARADGLDQFICRYVHVLAER